MPYVDPEARRYLDPTPHCAPPQNTGELTFQITCLLRRYLDHRCAGEGTLRYTFIADVLGALQGATVDFVDRIVRPYEKRKRLQNGDVWPDHLQADTWSDDPDARALGQAFGGEHADAPATRGLVAAAIRILRR